MPIGHIKFRIESTQEWVRVEARDPADEDGIRFFGAGNVIKTFLYSDVRGNSWNAQKLRRASAYIQENLFTKRTPLSDPSLVDDEHGPNGVDPARPEFFWEDGDLVALSAVIKDVQFVDGRLDFRIVDPRHV